MRAAIITCPRNGVDYLPGTLASMREHAGADIEVCVFSDTKEGPSEVQGAPVQHADAFMLERWTLVDRLGMDRKSVHSFNFERAFDWVAKSGTFGCVFEDDVVFADDWALRCEQLAAKASPIERSWAVALFHLYKLHDFTRLAVSAGKDALLRWKHTGNYYGSQGTLVSREFAAGFSKAAREVLSRDEPEKWQEWRANDLALKRYAMESGIRLMASYPCLVQHVGDVSSLRLHPPFIARCFHQTRQPETAEHGVWPR